MSRNMAEVSPSTTSSCGERQKRRSVRPAMVSDELSVPTRSVGVGMAVNVSAVIGGLLRSGRDGRGLRGRGTGEGEEDLVERGAAQTDVVDRDVAIGEGPHRVGETRAAVD